jgi:hypothetical protein
MATKLVRKAGQKSLKSQSAGYSTTNKKGETTYYKSAQDAPGYSDTTQSRSNMSAGNTPITKLDAGGNVITADKLKPTTPINLPTPPAVDGLGGVMDTGNAALTGGMGGTYDPKTKQITAPTADELFKSYQGANASAFDEMKSSEERLAEQQKMLKPKEKAVSSLSAQLNTITANRDAEMLGLEGQGRGVTESIIGGQQAQISREAAIRAMPIQAQLAVAQDDLDSARSYASQLFQAQSQDAQAKYNYQKELNSSIYSFLDSQQKTRLAQTEKAQDRAFQVEQANRSTLKQLSMQAIEYGQGALAGEIMRLDPASQTFDTDFGDVTSRLRKPVEASSDDSGIYTSTQLKAISKLNEDISKNPTYTKTASMRGYIDNVKGALQQKNGISDIAAINQFQKVIDEGAVTRDQDVALIKGAQSLVNKLQTKVAGLEKGDQLSPDLRNQMATLMDSLYTTQVKALQKDPYIAAKTREAELYGLTTSDTIISDIADISNVANESANSLPAPVNSAIEDLFKLHSTTRLIESSFNAANFF